MNMFFDFFCWVNGKNKICGMMKENKRFEVICYG